MRVATWIGRPDWLGNLTPGFVNGDYDGRLGAAPSLALTQLSVWRRTMLRRLIQATEA